ncbi:MAG: 50S ribosomal protein L3 [bacterium]|jgi:large subunit ribosomal protein L3|nr:50S ribosomal protein L3 [bacterium]MDD3805358.1 50S ribosomal protein L3 [bacterium]MDD4558374.1 50S ribosomal protein L3 [bacterium]
MAIGIIGKKLGMTQIFSSDGRVVPVTVIEAGPCKVVQVKNQDKDGYSAVQLGFGTIKERKAIKPLKGHYARVNLKPMRYLKEFRLKDVSAYESGQDITPSIFSEGEKVSVTGISKGKGFAGSIKRYHFRSGPTSHGSMHHRKPASAGATDAARVFKGKRSPGRMGCDQVTVKGLKVVRADVERNLLLIKGAVPGPTGGLVVVRKASE